MIERLAEQEMRATAVEEEEAVKVEHERRRAAAIALLNQHNPDWFASEVGVGKAGNEGEGPSTSRRGPEELEAGHRKAVSSVGVGGATGDEKLDAAAAVARQRALAMAILNEHNSDWFGELETKPTARNQSRSSICESTTAHSSCLAATGFRRPG